jgi:hypothetical protein
MNPLQPVPLLKRDIFFGRKTKAEKKYCGLFIPMLNGLENYTEFTGALLKP